MSRDDISRLRQEVRQAGELAQDRNRAVYAWLRWLVLLAAGAFAVLASLLSSTSHVGIARVCLTVSWVSLGCGILLGAIAIYGEVFLARDIVRKKVEEFERQLTSSDKEPRAVVAELPGIFKWCEKLCYLSLALFVVSFMVFAIVKT